MESARIFCAIDTPDITRAQELAGAVGPVTGGLKLGLEFFAAHGAAGVAEVQEGCPGASLFLDLKFHDIPNTVAGAVRSVTSALNVQYLNVHAGGGLDMMRAAREACPPEVRLLAVTILTSLGIEDLTKIGFRNDSAMDRVKALAELTREAGLDGVVCSAREIEALRTTCGEDFILMVPGIRPAGAEVGDQKRVMTPAEALRLGATHLVIGRPITGADDPAGAAQEILKNCLPA